MTDHALQRLRERAPHLDPEAALLSIERAAAEAAEPWGVTVTGERILRHEIGSTLLYALLKRDGAVATVLAPGMDVETATGRVVLPRDTSHITIYRDLPQGSPEWLQARCGMLTASEMKLIVTPTLKMASNDKERTHLYELAAQRISQYVEPHYVSEDMERGKAEEIEARRYYEHHFAPVEEVGFIVNRRWGFAIGYSPDGLVGEDGLIEAKSRRQKFQVQTIIENVFEDGGETIPADYVIQCQTGLLVSEREWLDFISFSGGLPMAVIRVRPNPKVQGAILEAAEAFEERIAQRIADYHAALDSPARLVPTERILFQEII